MMLRRKMVRDIRQNLSQFITIFLMVMIGVLVYVGIEAYMVGMQESADTFYSDNNLQDLNVIGNGFTEEDVSAIQEIDHVQDAERKLSITGTTDDSKTMLLNFLESNHISQFYLCEGEAFSYDTSGVWLDEFYAEANDVSVGDTLTVKYDGYTMEEKVLGLINVPDHLYDVKDDSELYPDHTEFGFAYLSARELEGYVKYKAMEAYGVNEETLAQMHFDYREELVFNYVMVDVDEKANVAQVQEDIEETIANAAAVIQIEDTKSYATYQGEIDEGKTYVGVFSGLFIFIAMLSVITTMTRVVQKQRTQIGTLKALGFKNRAVILHYISYGFWISLVAAVVGLLIGYYGIGQLFISMEMTFFELPNGHPVMVGKSYLCAALVVLCVCFVTFLVSYGDLRKNPAQTLRAEAPRVKGKSLQLTTKGFFRKMSFSMKWNFRDMIRNKIRTITGIVGIAGCCMLIVCAFGMLDSMNHFIALQFDDLYNFEYKLSLKENLSDSDLQVLTDQYGDNTSESYLIEIKGSDGTKESNNIFVTQANEYVRFVDKNGDFMQVDSDEGVYITRKLAKTDGYEVGDTITWRLTGSDAYYESKIVGFNKDPQNQNMTMTKEYFESLGNTYQPDSLYTNVSIADGAEIQNVTLIQNVDDLKEGMNNMLSTMKSMITLIIVIAMFLGAVIIYNMGVLSFSEKQYQFATLRVLGFQNTQVRKVFRQQNSMIAVISVMIGLPAGFFLTDWLFKTAIEESYDFGAYILPPTYLYALLGTFLVSGVASWILSRKIPKIDMVSSLKGNE